MRKTCKIYIGIPQYVQNGHKNTFQASIREKNDFWPRKAEQTEYTQDPEFLQSNKSFSLTEPTLQGPERGG